jgi:peptidoglycan/LPS O-acetylase OafA/YrhL
MRTGVSLGQASAATRKPADRSSRFRPDIEGLRAFAVVLVVLDHVWGRPVGGFVGVDVFYVISGFLITGLLLREYSTSNTISFVKFYVRRARRIAPVAIFVSIATIAVAYLLWYRSRADQTLSDGLASLLFVSNWHFIRLGTDYLQANGPTSPLQHFWSLAVEEQFYVIWPPLVLLVLTFVRRHKLSSAREQTAVATFFALIITISFVWSCYTSISRPAFAYFDSFSRAWELGSGALLAIWVGRKKPWASARVASLILIFSLTVLILSSLFITTSSRFPGPWAAVSVLSTAAIIHFGSAAEPWARIVLTNPAVRYIGRISYSLYLWHFPVTIFSATVYPTVAFSSSLMTILFMLILASLSYHFLEEPVRRSRWLQSIPGKSGRLAHIAVPSCVALIVAGMALMQYKGPAAAYDGRSLVEALGVAPTSPWLPPVSYASTAAIQFAVNEALDSSSWPALSPSLNALGENDGAPAMNPQIGCRNDVAAPAIRYCDYGPTQATRTAVVIGDSVAASWIPAVTDALVPKGWRVRGLTFGNCALAEADSYPRFHTARYLGQCSERRMQMLNWADSTGAELVITSSGQGNIDTLASGATGDMAGREWQAGTTKALLALKMTGRQVVVLSNPPLGGDMRSCATRVNGPSACVAERGSDYTVKANAEQKGADAAGATFVDTQSWFCTPSGTCPAFVASTVVRIDTTHLTDRYAESLAVVLRAALPTR